MTTQAVELSKVIRVHYGAALKEAARLQSGPHEVFGSSGRVGHHSEALFDYSSIVIGRKGSVGSVTYAPNGGWAIDTAFFVERLEPNSCDLRYLFYVLKNARLAQHTITTSIPGLSRDDIYRTRVLLPLIEEQRRIADILDKADAVRRKRKEAIGLSDALLRSTFLEMFGDPVTNPKGWPIKMLGELVDETRGISYGIVQRGPEIQNGVAVARISNFGDNRFDLGSSVMTSMEISSAYRRTVLRGGEVVVSIRGTVGRTAVVPAAAAGWNVSREVAVVPLLEGVSRPLVHRAILSEGVQSFILGNVKGVAQSGINLSDLRQAPIPIPPKRDVERFEKYARTAEALDDRLGRAVAVGERLFEVLVARAFSGSLDATC